MDLNEKLAARRKELAEQEAQERLQAQAAQHAQQQAAQEAAQAAALRAREANAAAEQSAISRQTPATKVVDLDGGMALLGLAMERTTKKQLAIFGAMAVLSLIGFSKDLLMALFWAVVALGYLGFTLHAHAEDIKRPKQAP